MLVEVFWLIFLVLLSAFFSGAEVALLSVTPIKIRTLLREKKKGAKALERIKHNSRKTIITILIGNNIVNILAASLATVLATRQFGSQGLGIATGAMTLFILLFGEITPKSFASSHAVRISLIISPIIELLTMLLYPVVIALEVFSNTITKIVKSKPIEPITESEIKSMLELSEEKNILDPMEKRIMEQALKFGETTAFDIMINIHNVFSIDGNSKIKDSISAIIESGFSRIPVHNGKKENLTGIVFIKDILRYIKDDKNHERLKDIQHNALILPFDASIENLLKSFKAEKTHIALIRKNNSIVGIATLEDVLEELVGEIADEFDGLSNKIERLDKNTIIVYPDISLVFLNRFFNTRLGVIDTDQTLNDFLNNKLAQDFFQSKRSVSINGIIFSAINIQNEKTKKVKITKTFLSKPLFSPFFKYLSKNA
jgi:putative hemolysin